MATSLETKPPRAKRKKMPRHPVERRAYRFAMDVSHAESQTLFGVVDRCFEVRNILAAERQEERQRNRAIRDAGLPVSYLSRADQYIRVAELQKADPRCQGIHSQVLQDIARRIDEGTKRWLESLKHKGERKVSPPGLLERKDYSSFTFPQCGPSIGIWDGRAHLSKLGSFKLIQHRKYRGTPKTLTIRFEEGQWWAVLTCTLQGREIYRNPAEVEHLSDVGGDPGLAALLTLSDGETFDPPKALKDALVALRHEQQDLSRKFEMRERIYEAEKARRKAAGEPPQPPLREIPYSNRLRAQIRKVAILHTKAARIREYHHCKLACILDRSYRMVAIEEHGVTFMLRNRRLARAAADRGIAAMKHWIGSKLGGRLIKTPNRRAGIGGNSQTCLCDAPVPKGLGDREHVCLACGLIAPRDVVSSNIVMQIAFGRNMLQQVKEVVCNTVAGQVIERRGGTKGRAQRVSAESGRAIGTASEVPVKRQPSPSLKTSNTRGGKPTREAKSVRINGKSLLLAEAQGLVSSPAADGKLRPSGR